VKHAATKTGIIALFCSVEKNTLNLGPNRLYVSYQDTDGTASSTLVTARLFRMGRFSSIGAITQIGTDITSASPSITSPAVALDNYMVRPFSYVFDFDAEFYFVYVEIKRASTAQTAILYGVGLDYDP